MKTVLLVGEDRSFTDQVGPALEARGIRLVTLTGGAEAEAAIRAGTPDLLVVDGKLPDTDGVSWIASLRAAGHRVPVVFVSAFWRDLPTFNRLTRDLGVNVVVHKPVAPAVFAQEVELQLGVRREPPPAAGAPAAAGPEQALLALRREYARALPAKLRALASALEQARAPGASRVLLEAARTLAHRLRGTAGSYGYRAVGEGAARVEEALLRASGEAAQVDWTEASAALHAATEAGQAAAASMGEPFAERAQAAKTGRLLVVSEDLGFLKAAEALGREQLLEVAIARGGGAAIAQALVTPPDAAFLDLPAETASELARELRAQPGCDGLPIAFVAERGAPQDRVAAAHAGASAFLVKPPEPEAFAAVARQLALMQRVRQPRVLVVDDDPAFVDWVRAVLQGQGLSVSALDRPEKILEALEETPPDLLLLDLIMPGLSGFDVCRMLRSVPRWQDLPVILVTGESGLEARVAAFQAGADDYLGKPVIEEELLARIRVRVERSRLLREKYDRDPLTGLLLRRPFVEALRARLLESSRHQRPLSLCLIDLDRFKSINDTQGHLAGDVVLAALGRLLGRRFRAEDLRGRWGGEEFILAFPGEPAETARAALERLLAELGRMQFNGERGEPFGATFSAGVAAYPQDGATVEALLQAADRRLYGAKSSGRNRVVSLG